MMSNWKMVLGANLLAGGGVRYAVWAPDVETMCVEISDGNGVRMIDMSRDDRGVFSVDDTGSASGTRYAFHPGDQPATPDPYSRYQPNGVHQASQVVDPSTFEWTDHGWTGITAEGLVIYELHIGTMTDEGTFRSLIEQLPELKMLGVTTLELMPVAQCPGTRNWGYDGVNLFAPANYYGEPDDLRALVNEAHAIGLSVILDVVYNHFGPEGNYLGRYTDKYLSEIHQTGWGAGLNWDGEGSEFVRQFAIDNACYWVDEFHMDGFRLDATQAIMDDSKVHVLSEMAQRAREVAGERSIYFVAEDGRHEITRARQLERGGEGLDAIWADDFHHKLRVLLANDHEMYFKHYSASMVDIAETINQGFGPSTLGRDDVTQIDVDDPASAFVFCIQNHDQIGNRPFGDRIHHEINADRYAVASALLLFLPETPMLFMGQEFAATPPFLYFTDHPEGLGRLVTDGRRKEFAGFGAFADEYLRESIPDPQAERTFSLSKLRLDEREEHASIYRMYRHLLNLRREDAVLCHNDRGSMHALALGAQLLAVHRWHGDEQRLLLANFGQETVLNIGVMKEMKSVATLPWELAWSTRGDESPSLDEGTLEQRRITLPARSAHIFNLTAEG